jgi:putative ABC transport system substrate-binding protein
LHEAVPSVREIAVIYNANNPNAEPEVKSLMRAAQQKGLHLHALEGSNVRDIEDAFSALISKRCNALVVMTDPLLNEQFNKITRLANGHALPAVYGYRTFAAAGGLMSYGTNYREARRQAGLLAARILQGEKPAELLVQRATKVELVINLKTAKALKITFPISLLGRADEVIE